MVRKSRSTYLIDQYVFLSRKWLMSWLLVGDLGQCLNKEGNDARIIEVV